MKSKQRLPFLFLCTLVLAVTIWTSGCKPPPSRVRTGRDANGNATGSNVTGSNVTGSNTTDAGVENGVEDIDDPTQIGDAGDKDKAARTGSGEDTAAAQKAPKYEVDPKDWFYCRGPNYNNISYETGLIDDFDPKGGEKGNVLWFRDDLGTRSTPIVMRGKLYTLTRSFPGTAKEGERVICVDAATGETLWENHFNVWLSDVPDTRVGWSSVVGDPETGYVYALGVCGYFQCIDGETGKTIWSRPMHEEFGFLSTYGGRTNFPIVVDDQVIVSAVVIGWGEMAKPAHRFVSMDKMTGEVVWFESTTLLPEDTTYSPPALATIGGQKQLIFGAGDGMVWALQPRTGRPIWKYGLSRRGLNVGPFVLDDLIFTGHSEEVWDPASNKMGSLVAFKAGQGDLTDKPENLLWKVDELMVGKSAPLVIDGRVYAFEDGGELHILDAMTGEEVKIQFDDRKIEKLTKMRNMRGSPLYADGKIYAVSEAGQWFIAKPHQEKGLEFIAYSGRDKQLDETNASPIASHGRVYITTSGGIYCLEDKTKEHGLAEAPPSPDENAVTDDSKPAHLQLVPAEVLMRPGEKVGFKARLYNASGQFLKEEDWPQYSIEGNGNITPGGKFTAPDDAEHQTVAITATVGDLSGTARVRIIPELPWQFTFDDGELPITWVGCRYRHIAADWDLLQELNQQDPLAGPLYIYLMSSFINSGRESIKYPDLDALLAFLGIQNEARTLDEVTKRLSPALKLLADKQVIASHKIEQAENAKFSLTAARGERKEVGNGVMVKIRTIPKGTRSQGWIGHPDLHDYTMQADVLGARVGDQIPEIGITAQGYTLAIQGNNQQIQIRTWVTQERLSLHEANRHEDGSSKCKFAFAWEPNKWYTMKLKVSNEENVARVQGKVWPKGEPEPDAWTIECEDPAPQRVGAPGFYGDANFAEIFIDNIKVTPNEPVAAE